MVVIRVGGGVEEEEENIEEKKVKENLGIHSVDG